MAENMIGKLSKTMMTGLAIGFAVGGIAGAWAARTGGEEGHADCIAPEREGVNPD